MAKVDQDNLDIESVDDSLSGTESTRSDEEDFNKPEYDKDLEQSESEDGIFLGKVFNLAKFIDFWEDDDPVVKKETLMDSEPTSK